MGDSYAFAYLYFRICLQTKAYGYKDYEKGTVPNGAKLSISAITNTQAEAWTPTSAHRLMLEFKL
ncbi:MAG: hypothetical protein A2X45_01075 [Lentisphaerae bacterium GWF2_50_93]|nr:MAG: hypothetical protein A2X45_01075 [Lentisphaerae bacterium GWF2_50_93]